MPDTIEGLLAQQGANMSAFNKFIVNFKKCSKVNLTSGYLKGRAKGLEELWRKFQEIHYKILLLIGDKEPMIPYFTDDMYSQYEESYYEYSGKFTDYLEEFGSVKATTGEVAKSDVRLPPINIPSFSGKYSEWQAFHDLFQALVGANDSLTDVQKLHYLRSSVTSEAEQLIRSYTLTEVNYKLAWDALCKRYNNVRLMVNAQLAILLNSATIPKDSATTIRQLLDATNESRAALKSLKVEVENWDLAIIHIQTQRLPPETRNLWETKLSTTTEPPTLTQYLEFLEARFRTLEAVPQTSTPKHTSTYNRTLQTLVTARSNNTNLCAYCQLSHHLRQCTAFQTCPLDKKMTFVKGKNICFNCLAADHQSKRCPSKRGCLHCGRRHHTTLHDPTSYEHPSINNDTSNRPVSSYVVSHLTDTVLLSTALIKVQSNGTCHTLRALLDTGSQVSFITTAAMQRLRLKALPVVTQTKITGIGNMHTTRARKIVRFQLGPRFLGTFTMTVEAIVMPSLTDRLPHSEVPIETFAHLQDLNLADPLYHQPGAIDVILGADVYPSLIRQGLRKGLLNTPLAQNTALGWILLGPITNKTQNTVTVQAFFNQVQLDETLRKFWEMEEVEIIPHASDDDVECENHFQNHYSRAKDGRYIVKLPFKRSASLLGSSFPGAFAQYKSSERRMSREPSLHTDYQLCLQEYLKLHHLEQIPSHEINNQTCYYLPHHGVIKESSSTTKLRVVFNASYKTDSGYSLNELLHVGPRLQQDLPSILIRWRMHGVVISADMEKMYRQVLIAEEDRDFHRILWRPSNQDAIQHFRLQTVTFGVSSAPFLAMRVIQQLVQDEGKEYPLASKALSQELYVDNLLSGGATPEEALQLQNELISLLKKGGFHLRQWASNVQNVLKYIPEADRLESTTLQIHDTTMSTVNALGIMWYRLSDELSLKCSLKPVPDTITKRNVLSYIASLFDPLGLFAPVLIAAKINLQKLWLQGLSWDQPLPGPQQIEWHQFMKEIVQLDAIKIPRWFNTNHHSRLELHGFCDASEKAYGAVIYLKAYSSNPSVTKTSLVMAKTKVAPVKTVSLPRLELCGAALLARVMKRVKSIINVQSIRMYCWSDSTIVLAWLSKHPCEWKTFVANRTSLIRELIPTAVWRHVISQENPADLITRGVKPSEISTSSLWWQGPSWLRTTTSYLLNPKTYDTEQESRKLTSLTTIAMTYERLFDITTCSSYIRLIRVTAYCFRFIQRCQGKDITFPHAFLSALELKAASFYWVKMVQQDAFFPELQSLKSNGTTSKDSNLKRFTPMLDEQNILRIGGRLQHADVTYDEKHPVILPSNHHFTKLIVAHCHLKTLHGGLSATINLIRMKYWVPKLRSLVKSHIHKCIICFRLSKATAEQLMGNLPKERVTPAPPFTTTGLDYAGPIFLRVSKGRNTKTYKGYIALFVCFVTKAIHLEVISDLTTEALLAAVRRFVSRRGLCKTIFSDCGTNFVGAKRVLDKTLQVAQEKATRETAEELSNDGINWSFIPPGSPHFGGLWEAGVRSVKHHLRRIVGNATLTYEELTTVLSQIEACLNSRPLSALNDCPTDLAPLTPGHFLIGRALTAPPQEDLTNEKQCGLRRWNLMQKIQQDFWARWRMDYLHTLQQKPKWFQSKPNPKVGQLVIIKDERLPPLKWAMGRITAMHPGSDGLTRVLDIRTKHTTIRRPITKICILPSQH